MVIGEPNDNYNVMFLCFKKLKLLYRQNLQKSLFYQSIFFLSHLRREWQVCEIMSKLFVSTQVDVSVCIMGYIQQAAI